MPVDNSTTLHQQCLARVIKELSREDLEIYALGSALISTALLHTYGLNSIDCTMFGSQAMRMQEVSQKVCRRVEQLLVEVN